MKTKKRTGFVYHPDYLKHDAGPFHPESPQRLMAIIDGVKSSGLTEKLIPLEPSPASVEQVQYIHTESYVKFLKEFCNRGGGNLEIDTGVSRDSYDVALLAVGGVIKAIDAVLDGEVDNAFAAVRPPGHHALADTGKGFCLFNNLAIGTKYAQKERGLNKILIVDWDVHHGDGTHYIFYEDPSVFYFSVHQFPFYPGTGRAYETGKGAGAGYTLNVPVPFGAGVDLYIDIFQKKFKPMGLRFNPDIIFISAGFDGHKDDPIGGTELTSESYGVFTDIVMEVAEETCGGRVVSALEGGYEPKAISESVVIHLKHLMGEDT
ncbi:TPA: histone deacetylase [Candidatus Poribacteria bacterium]|nr:histone deacetylase [Candidatus Poribacteria bacterium]